MKKLILLSLFITFMASAMTADQLKENALKACDTQAAEMPEESRDLILKSCKCYANNTDYEAVLANVDDPEKLQADAIAVATQCQKEM
ncbi:MAG: hypothetical protein L3J83_10110 [Proteobacteria bacterium]|nr:hypothetical protein [Pseudomonadota bacterium]